jgi:hypothetical protein
VALRRSSAERRARLCWCEAIETGAVAGSFRCDYDDMGRFKDALATFQQAGRFDMPQALCWISQLGDDLAIGTRLYGAVRILSGCGAAGRRPKRRWT